MDAEKDLGSDRDSTFRKEDMYKSLFENVHDGIYRSTPDGKIITVNPTLVKMLGYADDEELMRVSTFDLIHPDDRRKVQRLFRDLMKNGMIPRIELRVLRKDGTSFWADFSVSVLKDASGKHLYLMDIVRDISERKEAEEQLMVLKHSVDVHYDGAYWLDTDNKMVYVNNAGCSDTGYTREELIGKDVSLINPLATKEVLKLIWDKLHKDGSFTAESVHRRKNGTIYPVELVTSYINFGGKEYSCGFARDISDRKASAEEMRLRLEQLRQIIDLVPSYIFAKDIDGKFLLANKALADVFGLSPQEIQGKKDSDYGASKEQIKWYRKNDLEVIKKGTPLFIPEEQVLRKDGTLGWFQTVKIPYKHPGYDKPAILGVATEITERKEVEDELRKSEERFRKLFESHSAVKLLIDPESGSIIDANKAAAEFYGWSVPKLKKMRITDISVNPEEEILKNMRLVMKTSSASFEATHKLAKGSFRDVEIFASKINIDNRDYLHSIIHDITDKKKILKYLVTAKEKAEESDKIKTAFLHNISHEIRTPMNAIVGFSSLLDSPELSEEARKQYTSIIFQSSNQLLSIITDIVDISNIETGHVKIAKEAVLINRLIEKIHDQYSLRADESKLTLRYILPKGTDKLKILSDETKLVQIISNLLNNSFKFTRKGKIEFGYEVKGACLEFFVDDTGAGIKKENIEKIFERFFQDDNISYQKTDGTGLGLSICRGYVELMGGRIWAESKKGKGSVLRFTIPLTPAKTKSPARKKNKAR